MQYNSRVSLGTNTSLRPHSHHALPPTCLLVTTPRILTGCEPCWIAIVRTLGERSCVQNLSHAQTARSELDNAAGRTSNPLVVCTRRTSPLSHTPLTLTTCTHVVTPAQSLHPIMGATTHFSPYNPFSCLLAKSLIYSLPNYGSFLLHTHLDLYRSPRTLH